MKEINFKTKEDLLTAPIEDLTFEERLIRSILERKPEVSLEETIESLDMIQ